MLNRQKVDNSDYTSSLCQYFDQARSITGLSVSDLRNILSSVQGICAIDKAPVTVQKNANAEDIKNTSKREIDGVNVCFKYGEHIACAWTEDVGDTLNWYLSIVDKYDVNDLYFVRA